MVYYKGENNYERIYNLCNFNNFIYYSVCRRYEIMRYIEEKILKSLDEDIKILKRANFKTNEIIDHIRNFRDFSNDNTEEYKKEIDKLMEKIKC